MRIDSNLKRLTFQWSGKDLRGNLFHKVAVLRKKASLVALPFYDQKKEEMWMIRLGRHRNTSHSYKELERMGISIGLQNLSVGKKAGSFHQRNKTLKRNSLTTMDGTLRNFSINVSLYFCTHLNSRKRYWMLQG